MRVTVLVCNIFVAQLFGTGAVAADESVVNINIQWANVEGISKTTATLQVVVNPRLRQESPIHDRAWKALRDLGADTVRFVPWYPYPRLGVAELDPPTSQKTFWDFSLLDPLVTDFFQATAGHPVMVDFSTVPQWMLKADVPATKLPTDPNEAVWSYAQGAGLGDGTGLQIGEYYGRLAGWYMRGGFHDEVGNWHESQHHFKIDYWEILNEPEYEHYFSAQDYTEVYDRVTDSVHHVSAETKFVGMSLAEPMKGAAFFEYFLNPKNHRAGAPLDMISYHFYAVPTPDQAPEVQQFTFFEQADKFLVAAGFIDAIRQRLSPHTKTAVNEIGCILPQDIGPSSAAAGAIPQSYWNLCGAMFAYVYAGLVRQGVEVVSASQLVGYPTQFPSVTMIDWTSGEPNARYWVVKLLRDHFQPGDRLVETRSTSPYIFSQAFVSANGARQLLIVNKRARACQIKISGAAHGKQQVVDETTGVNAAVTSGIDSDGMVLQGFAVAVITLP